MKNLLAASLLFFLFVASFSCEKSDSQVPASNTTVELTVKDENGEMVPNLVVYLFKNASTTASGKNPEIAVASDITDEQGVVSLSIDDVFSETMYFTVLEFRLSGTEVLGSLELTVPSPRPSRITEELQVTGRKLYYPYGHMPGNIDSRLAKQEYDRWKTELVRSCNGGKRVIADPAAETKVEAIGFGTILSAYANDQATFDGLMAFYESKRTAQAKQMMAWSVTCDGILDPGSATDGDIDVAFANIVAHVQWGGNYLDKALEIIAIIKDNLLLDCQVNGSTTKVLAPGYSNGLWGGCGMTDIQYYTPGFFRVFAKVTGDPVWDQLADDSYTILNASANPTTGLVPDWQTAAGSPGPGGRADHFGYDACRVPWRMSLDYLWNGNDKAQQWCSKVSDWAYGLGASNIVDGYELDGTPNGVNGLNSSFLGGFTVAMMTNNKLKTEDMTAVFAGLNDSYWFNLNTRILYLFALTGNFWEPEV